MNEVMISKLTRKEMEQYFDGFDLPQMTAALKRMLELYDVMEDDRDWYKEITSCACINEE